MTSTRLLCLIFLLACKNGPMHDDAGAPLPGTDGGVVPGIDSGAPPAGGWAEHHHPCVGNRTTALFVDDDGTIWVGCGDTTSGFGVFRSSDDGATWDAPATQPAGVAGGMRVNSIERGPDGLLYLAGTGSAMAIRLDTTSEPMMASQVLTSVPRVGFQFPVGRFRQLSDGRALAESDTGTDLLYRESGSIGASASMWTDASAAMSPAIQMLDLVVSEDRFYACGSTIAQPPVLFLPSRAPSAEPYEFEVLTLTTAWGGELWGLAVSPDRIVAAGVDQSSATGKIFVSGADRYDAADYREIDITPLVNGSSGRTWARGVCMRGDAIAVVGENQPLRSGGGFVLVSDDGGETFTDITPAGAGNSISRCSIEADGTLVAAGEGGWIGLLR
jgi:hypothetical protein